MGTSAMLNTEIIELKDGLVSYRSLKIPQSGSVNC